MLNVKTQLVLTSANASLDILVMDERAQMLMNATSVSIIVVTMHVATMPLVLIIVVVLKDSKEMACHVKM